MRSEAGNGSMAAARSFEDLTLEDMAHRIEHGLRAIYEAKWHGGLPVRASEVKGSVVVYVGSPGRRTKLARAEALRFLDILGDVVDA